MPMKLRPHTILMLLLSACLLSSASSLEVGDPPYTQQNPIPVCTQWNENHGYCGEASLIAAGLYFGQYMSQYDVRALAMQASPSPTTPPQHDPCKHIPCQVNTQLLIGENDTFVAQHMHLAATEWPQADGATSQDFLAWVKEYALQGYPVIIGVFVNGLNDPQYDHIVLVDTLKTSGPYDPNNPPNNPPPPYSSDDILGFSDHGATLFPPPGTQAPIFPYHFQYPFGTCQRDRHDASHCPYPYSVPLVSDTVENYNCGIAITGVVDPNNETFPVSLSITPSLSGVYTETDSIAKDSCARPSSNPITLTVNVSGLTTGAQYVLYYYNDITQVPDSDFNTHASQAAESISFTATGATYTTTKTIQSSETAVYRCVAAH